MPRAARAKQGSGATTASQSTGKSQRTLIAIHIHTITHEATGSARSETSVADWLFVNVVGSL